MSVVRRGTGLSPEAVFWIVVVLFLAFLVVWTALGGFAPSTPSVNLPSDTMSGSTANTGVSTGSWSDAGTGKADVSRQLPSGIWSDVGTGGRR